MKKNGGNNIDKKEKNENAPNNVHCCSSHVVPLDIIRRISHDYPFGIPPDMPSVLLRRDYPNVPDDILRSIQRGIPLVVPPVHYVTPFGVPCVIPHVIQQFVPFGIPYVFGLI